ncbi:glycosyl transferase [Ramlibacter ginsenosidimutans]|uniref:Glycosyl transferase n=1 Tax=Ramlibacter ginsenosidimutans TaxID=502333 RepID=A0A934TNI4_9BURK|nr:glycosyl transferase [Ramlibacter ginsenosidimutans]MBK6004584.1 glycosyl transferase [Ramlibacter ginsenosidimutans]
MKKVHVFTSAAFNYIPKVRLLFESLRRHHPELVLHLALADRLHPGNDLSREPFDHVTAVEDLGIPNTTRWIFCHRIVELATAIKPFMLAKLLERDDCEKVLYMDPDTVAFSRLDDVLAALDAHSVVLTPHLTMPEQTLDAVMDNEISCLKHGVYNLGFVGVKADEQGREFAHWWGERIYRFCRDDIKNGLFTDQRWIDLVPAFFSTTGILRTPRLNVATWNIRRRKLEGTMRDGIRVNGEPLGFYHFTGFDSGAHKAMADKHADGNTTVAELVQWYLDTTSRLAQDPLAKVQWAYGTFSDGTPITPAQRIAYRDRPDLQAAFPDPFRADGYAQWWQQQGQLEYPGVDSADPKAALERLTVHLSPGLSPVPPGESIRSAGAPVAHPSPLLVRAHRVWKQEGIKGVLRRLM